MEIKILCKLVELQTQFFLPKFFGATPPGTTENGTPKNQFFEQLKLECYFFLISVVI